MKHFHGKGSVLLMQDALYLEQFGRVLAVIGARVSDIETALAYMQCRKCNCSRAYTA